MRGYHRWVGLLVLLSSPLLAETTYIENFHDEEHAFVMNPEGEFVPATELELDRKPDGTLGWKIIGKENGQYLFTAPNEEGTYRVFIPEVITSAARKAISYCDQSAAVFPDDQRNATIRGIDEECE